MKTISERTRVLLVDDQPLYRQTVRGLLGIDFSIDIVGEAADGDEAVGLAASCRPDLVIMDITMPVMDGLTATELIRKANPLIQVIILSSNNKGADIRRALQAGVIGYILKDEQLTKLLPWAVNAARINKEVFSENIWPAMMEFYREELARTDSLALSRPG